jgi:hypothetical protein
MRAVTIRSIYLNFEEWDVHWREVQLNNRTSQPMSILVEHPRSAPYELYDTPEPKERTDEQYLFEVGVGPAGEAKLRIQERRLLFRREELRQQSYVTLQGYLRRGLLEQSMHDRLAGLLGLWEKIAQAEKRLGELEAERQKIFRAQQQAQGNMGALATTGKEGALRARYVDQLAASEDQLRALDKTESALKEDIERLKAEAETLIKALQ